MLRKKYKTSVRKGMKRYVSRKRRAPRVYSLTGDVMHAKCEDYGNIGQNNGSDVTIWGDTSQSYFPIAAMLQNSPSFTTQVAVYARYKITALSIRLASCCDPALASARYVTGAAPSQAIAFYPNSSGVSLGNSPMFNDRRIMMEVSRSLPLYKTWRFPDNFYDGGGYGLGIWSQCSGYLGQTGQLSVYPTTSSVISATTGLFTYCVTVHVTFSDKNS